MADEITLKGATCQVRIVNVQKWPEMSGSNSGAWLGSFLSWTPIIEEMDGKWAQMTVIERKDGLDAAV